MTAAFFFLQYVYLAGEVGVRMYAARFRQYLTAFDFLAVNTTQQRAYVVACQRFVQGLTEHFQTGDNGRFLLVFHADDFNGVAYMGCAAFDTAGSNGAAAGDGEYVFYRHQERFVSRAFRSRNVVVYFFHQLQDAAFTDFALVAFQGFQGGTYHDGNVIAGEFVAAQQVTNFHFYQLDQFRVIYHVCLVQVHYHGRYAYLTGQQDVFAGLRHRAVSCAYYQDRTVHLCGAGDHVLYIVSVAGAVNVCIVTVVRLVFYVSRVDGDTTFSFFRSLIDHAVIHELCAASFCQHFGDSSGQGGFAMVYVTDGADVNMRFCSFKLCLCHFFLPP